jgi:hypothetical protein
MHASSEKSLSFPAIGTQLLIGLALALAMMLTRSHHFGTAFSLPDASLAVFFLAGMWIRPTSLSVLTFSVLLVCAALADQLAFAANVSNWCVTAAYGFLVPAYGVMWFAGRWCRKADIRNVKGVALVAAAVVLGSAVYFAISNGSFFWFSGYFDAMSFVEYWSRTLRYFPWYLLWASVYVGGGCALSLTRHVFIHSNSDVSSH